MGRNLAPLSTWEDRKGAAVGKTTLTLVDDASDSTVVLTTSRGSDYEIQYDVTDDTWAMVEV